MYGIVKARQYTDIIEIWKSTQTSDGYGGTTPTDSKQFDKWAKKETSSAGSKFQQFGLNDFKNPVIFRVRKGNTTITEDMFVKYNGSKFIIKGIENVNLDNREINIFCDET